MSQNLVCQSRETPYLTVKKGEREGTNDTVHYSNTDDPWDPLNFPTWHKIAALLVAALYAFTANFCSGVIAPAFQLWPMIFPRDPRSISDLSVLIAVCSLLKRLSAVSNFYRSMYSSLAAPISGGFLCLTGWDVDRFLS